MHSTLVNLPLSDFSSRAPTLQRAKTSCTLPQSPDRRPPVPSARSNLQALPFPSPGPGSGSLPGAELVPVSNQGGKVLLTLLARGATAVLALARAGTVAGATWRHKSGVISIRAALRQREQRSAVAATCPGSSSPVPAPGAQVPRGAGRGGAGHSPVAQVQSWGSITAASGLGWAGRSGRGVCSSRRRRRLLLVPAREERVQSARPAALRPGPVQSAKSRGPPVCSAPAPARRRVQTLSAVQRAGPGRAERGVQRTLPRLPAGLHGVGGGSAGSRSRVVRRLLGSGAPASSEVFPRMRNAWLGSRGSRLSAGSHEKLIAALPQPARWAH